MIVLSLAFPHILGAQAHFLRGVKYLHRFGFEEAVESFQAAYAIEPDFALVYWGETLSRNDSRFSKTLIRPERRWPDSGIRPHHAPRRRLPIWKKGFLQPSRFWSARAAPPHV